MASQTFIVPLERLVVVMVAKSPDASLCYGLDWTVWLSGCEASDSIASAVWDVPDGLTEVSGGETITDAVTSIKVSGGTAGEVYRLTCTVTTTNGIIDERSIDVSVDE